MATELFLLVDDDRISNLITKKVIIKKFPVLSIESFCDPLVALDYFRTTAGLKDRKICLFLDINMPSLNGWEFLHIFEEEMPHLSCDVIILTSSISDSDRSQSMKFARVRCFLTKPLSLEKLDTLNLAVQ